MSRPHELGSSPARDAVRQRTGARRNDDEEDGGRTGGRRTDEQMADDGDSGERASDHDEDEGEDYENDSNDEDEGENEEEEDDEGEGASDDSKGQAADEAMHANKGLPCVPVGENFTVRGIEFKRTATKQAQCMRCNHRFMPKGYGQHIAKLPSTRCTAPASRGDKRKRWTRHERSGKRGRMENGSATCVRIGTTGIATHRFRAGL